MEFIDFARAHGLMLNDIESGRWVRVPTADHPRSRNGAYKYMGDHGFVQNHATQTEVSLWRPERPSEIRVDPKVVIKIKTENDAKRDLARRKAAEKAQWILDQTILVQHDYLERKGFETMRGNVWQSDQDRLLVVPMRIGSNLVGAQLISASGDKKFLFGQRTNDATFTMGAGDPIFCEGYATGLSARTALAALKIRRSVVVCFSAGNLLRCAKVNPKGVVIADNDESGTGERVAKESGLKYWMSDKVGEDFNDFHQRNHLFKASQAIRKLLS
jgi:putative DNA primase/helicase